MTESLALEWVGGVRGRLPMMMSNPPRLSQLQLDDGQELASAWGWITARGSPSPSSFPGLGNHPAGRARGYPFCSSASRRSQRTPTA
jgi:hypothetical protein